MLSVESLPSYWGKTFLVTTTEGKVYVLKQKGAAKEVRREHTLLSHLQARGVPVAPPLVADTGLPCIEDEGRVFALYAQVRGAPISDHYADGAENRASGFGKAIALLHSGLRTFPETEVFPALNVVEHVTDWAIPEIARHPAVVDINGVRSAAGLFEPALRPSHALLPGQLIHRDPNPANMLFLDGELTAWLDFDMVTRSVRVFDPCYCATSILVGGWQSPEKRNAWPRLFAALLSAYGSSQSLTETEAGAVFPVLLAIQLMFMAFSLGQKQDSAARCNGEVLAWLVDNRQRIEREMEEGMGQSHRATA